MIWHAFSEPITNISMKTDPQYQRQRCSTMAVVSGNIRFMRIQKALKIDVFDYSTVVWCLVSKERHEYLHKSESRPHLYCKKYRSIFIQIFVVGSERRMFSIKVHNGSSMSSKVVDFGTNRKCVCDYLLVINSNLGPILPRFRDIAGFLLRRVTPSLFHPNFGVSSWIVCRCSSSEDQRPYANYSRNYFWTSPIYMPTVPQQMGGRTTYDSNTTPALHASRGKSSLAFSSLEWFDGLTHSQW